MASSFVYSSGADAGVRGAQTEAREAWAAAHGPGIARVRGTDRPWPACSPLRADPGGSKVEMWCFRHRGVTLLSTILPKKATSTGNKPGTRCSIVVKVVFSVLVAIIRATRAKNGRM